MARLRRARRADDLALHGDAGDHAAGHDEELGQGQASSVGRSSGRRSTALAPARRVSSASSADVPAGRMASTETSRVAGGAADAADGVGQREVGQLRAQHDQTRAGSETISRSTSRA